MAEGVEAGEAQEAARVDVSPSATVRAAGGIVHRVGDDGSPQVLLVHRPRYDDWSLPKGKSDPGERDEETALREVEEETGLRCLLGEHAGETRYRDSKGQNKVVHYWLMEPPPDGASSFVPNDEVDELRWCTMTEASKRLSYAHDRKLLQRVPVPE
jgi:8-oxo-dGTP pyrophosphatase MutT (NUDIX family)